MLGMTTAYGSREVPEILVRHRLRIAREYAGLDQAGLAERMGVSRVVQELMRHKSISSTVLYTQVPDARRHEAIGRLDVLRGAIPDDARRRACSAAAVAA